LSKNDDLECMCKFNKKLLLRDLNDKSNYCVDYKFEATIIDSINFDENNIE